MKARAKEVSAQCKTCKDLFSLVVIDRRGEISIEPTQACEARREGGTLRLVHRPGHCDGEARVIWAPEWGPLFTPWPKHDPLVAAGATAG